MTRAATIAIVTAALALAHPARAADDTPGAIVAGRPIPLVDVDARCAEPCARMRAEITERRWAMLETLVGEALLAGAAPPDPHPVTDADVAAYLAAHAADFRGPRERDGAAVRFFLEREARRAAERARIDEQRAQRPPRLRTAPADPALAADPVPDRVLAEVDDRPIRERDVEARLALTLYRLRGALARERRRHAETLVAEALWAAAAAERGETAAALRTAARARATPVTDADVERYWAAEVRPRGGEKRPDRLRPYLEFRAAQAAEDAAIEALRARFDARVLVAEPEPPRLALGAGHLGWRGNPSPRVRLVFLTGFRASSRAMWPVVRELAREPGTALAVRPLLPLWDPEATATAVAVRCATAHRKGWELLDRVAGGDAVPPIDATERLAVEVGVPGQQFAACVADPRTHAAVAAESAEAERLGLDEAPALLVDGIAYTGRQDLERLRAIARQSHRP